MAWNGKRRGTFLKKSQPIKCSVCPNIIITLLSSPQLGNFLLSKPVDNRVDTYPVGILELLSL